MPSDRNAGGSVVRSGNAVAVTVAETGANAQTVCRDVLHDRVGTRARHCVGRILRQRNDVDFRRCVLAGHSDGSSARMPASWVPSLGYDTLVCFQADRRPNDAGLWSRRAIARPGAGFTAREHHR